MSDLRPLFVSQLSLLVIATVAAAETLPEPYTVWVGAAGAKVYSGPGDDYYATQQLAPGAKCEVYEELRDGWLAIRPPEGSYSLVLRSALEIHENDTACVTRNQTPSRVGSVLADNFSSVHVRLDEGELVQVIDYATTSSSQWVTIAPPPGEFRWIRLEDSTPTPGVQPIGQESGNGGDWRGIVKVDRNAESESEKVIRVVAHDAPEDKSDTPAPEKPMPSQATSPASPADQSFASQFDQLEVEVARRLAGPVNLWVFEDLEQRAARLMSQASSQPAQQAVSNLADRLSRFAAVGERYRSNQKDKPSGQATSDSILPIQTDESGQSAALAGYDAVGVLRPVVSKHGNAPPYALVDDAGNIVTFVTPSPSLNLQQHLGQRVGVSGTRGFIPEFRSRNIQTARIAPVESALRR